MKQQLIPKARRRKRQPSADQLREQLALAADEIIRLREAMDGATFATWEWHTAFKPRPWWRRIFRSKAG